MTIQPKRVLVADDETLITMLLTDMLGDLGSEVVGPANTYEEAISLASSSDFDWAILDLNMDGLSTIPVAKILRDRGIPFVIASGAAPENHHGVLAGVGWLQKPFEFAAVARVFSAALPAS